MFCDARVWVLICSLSVCADNPVLTLAICSWFIAALTYGIQYLIIITDPVELWASPTSRTRMEKDYFDSRFGPFFRTNQIFIKPTNTQYVTTFIFLIFVNF